MRTAAASAAAAASAPSEFVLRTHAGGQIGANLNRNRGKVRPILIAGDLNLVALNWIQKGQSLVRVTGAAPPS